jgi:ADP-ribose pyrophosphatase YjhB (NUDIX family)
MAAYREAKWITDITITELTGVSPLAVVNTVGSQPTSHTIACFTLAGAIAGGVTSIYTCAF